MTKASDSRNLAPFLYVFFTRVLSIKVEENGYRLSLIHILIVGLIMGGRINHISLSAVLMLLYLACISAVAYSLWGILLKHNPVSKVAIFGFTNPVFGVLLSAWWLGEGSSELGINALIAVSYTHLDVYKRQH